MQRVKKILQWIDDRTGISNVVVPLANHPVSPDVKWLYVFGSATFIIFILQVITGVSLALLYQPTSETAYQSVSFITHQVPLGSILRGFHFFGASSMIVLVVIHMTRVYIMASYKYPREMSWISGSILLVLTLGMGFTGQLLRWDNNSVWGAIVAAEQVGRIPLIGDQVAHFILAGETIGGATLSRFFAIHVFLIPALLFGIIGLHVYLAIRNGVSEPPKAGRVVDPATYRAWFESMLKEKGLPFWPNTILRDTFFVLGVILVIIILASVVGPPKIDIPPNPANIDSNPRPDWYFLWFFAILALMPRWLENYAIVFGPIIVGMILILLPIIFNKGERHPARRPWSIVIVLVAVTTIITLSIQGVKAPWSPNFAVQPLPPQVIGNIEPVATNGADLFFKHGCIYCHNISGNGGHRGPDLTDVAERLTKSEMTIRIVNGGGNMPAFGGTLSKVELDDLVSFLRTRKTRIK